MANFRPYRGSKATLPSGNNIEDGALYFCTDTLEIYEGYTVSGTSNKALRRYSGITSVNTVNDLPVLTQNDEGIVRYVVEGNILAIFNGTNWDQLNHAVFTGATSQTAGKAGLVPTPNTTDTNKFLRGDGSWQTVTSAGNTFSTVKVKQQSTSTDTTTGASTDVTIDSGSSDDTIEFKSGNKWIGITGAVEGEGTTQSKYVKIGHTTSGVTAGSVGPSSNSSPGFGSNITIPSLTFDAAGHITAAEDKTITLPTGIDISATNGSESDTFAKKYTFSQNGTNLSTTIDIPKDMVVESGIVTDVAANTVSDGDGGYLPAGKYIELTLSDAASTKLYISVADLVDAYTAQASATQVQLAISNTNEISATIVDGSIGTTKLANTSVTTGKIADNAVTNTKLDTMNAYTVKANNSNSAGSPSDVALVDLKLDTFSTNSLKTGDIASTDSLADALNKLSNKMTWGTF